MGDHHCCGCNEWRVRFAILIVFQVSCIVCSGPPFKAVNLGGWLVAEDWLWPPPPVVGEGEFQITKNLGDRATEVMQQHWETFITEEDFAFMKEKGLNAVRIPVGWWTAKDQSGPPPPFVKGSLQVLEKAFQWAEQNDLQVILDLHAPPQSPNGNPHSGAKVLGIVDWGQQSIDQTIEVIVFFVNKFKGSSSLAAVELMNEPAVPQVPVEALLEYYRRAYDAIRSIHPTLYVIMPSWRNAFIPEELVQVASVRSNVVVDVHFYNLYLNKFKGMSVKDNINYIYNTRAPRLRGMMDRVPFVFVGEWSAEMEAINASDDGHRRFAQAQLDVYGKASFGWAIWTWKSHAHPYWSLKHMLKHGIVTLQ